MSHNIPHAAHFAERKSWDGLPGGFVEVRSCLADDFEASNNSILLLGVREEILFDSAFDVGSDQPSCVEDVAQPSDSSWNRSMARADANCNRSAGVDGSEPLGRESAAKEANTGIILEITERDAYFWGTHGGAELDLILTRGGAKYGFEFKFGETVTPSKSMRVALADLNLKRLFVVYPGARRFELDDAIVALPLTRLAEESAIL